MRSVGSNPANLEQEDKRQGTMQNGANHPITFIYCALQCNSD